MLVDVLATDPEGTTTLDAWEPSPAGDLLAVQTSRRGTEQGTLTILDVATTEVVEEPMGGLRCSPVAWLPEGDAFYYVRRADDAAGGANRRGIWWHRLGTAPETDVLVHVPSGRHRTVPTVRVDQGRWLVVSESFGTGHRNDVWLADLRTSPPWAPALREVQRGCDAETEARVGADGYLYARTTLGAPRRRLCRADPEDPRPERWRELVAEDPDATLDAFALVDGPVDGGAADSVAEILIVRTRRGISELSVHDPAGAFLRCVELPGEGMVDRFTAERAGAVQLVYASAAQPPCVLTHHAGQDYPRVWTGPPAADTPIERHSGACVSQDGTTVPVTVFSVAGVDAPRPTILHAYGNYGRSRQFGFSASMLAWLTAGGQYVVAHIRGGGDAGRWWHMDGARTRKPNAIADLLAACRWVADQGYAAPTQLCLSGGSGGGLLVLAAATAYPQLCNAVIASAPLADMVRFERLGLGALWTQEFGTVADPDEFEVLLSYSPYHNVRRGEAYPAVLLTGFHEDTRTGAAHPRKICAALQGATASHRPILLRYEYGVGHGARSVTRAIELAADAHAFAAAWTGMSRETCRPVSMPGPVDAEKGGESRGEHPLGRRGAGRRYLA